MRSSRNFGEELEDPRSDRGESRSEKRSGISRNEGRGIPRAISSTGTSVGSSGLVLTIPWESKEPKRVLL